jgi:hypothetical protein
VSKHPPPEPTPEQAFLENLSRQLAAAVEAKERLLKTIRKANRRYGIRHADLMLVCDLPEELQALNRQYRNLEWRIDVIREEQKRVIVRPDGEITLLPHGHTFAGFSENGGVISSCTTVVHDEAAEAAEHARHTEQRAAIIEQYGSEEAYSEHAREETERMRAATRQAFRRERNRRDRGHLPDPPRSSPRHRARERRPGSTRRGAASSTSSGVDPGDDSDSEPPRRRGQLRHISLPLAAEMRRLAARMGVAVG